MPARSGKHVCDCVFFFGVATSCRALQDTKLRTTMKVANAYIISTVTV